MIDRKTIPLHTPAEERDALMSLVRNGARELIAEAVEAELAEMLETARSQKTETGHQAVVRNGYLPERTLQTGVGLYRSGCSRFGIAAAKAASSTAI